MYETTIRQAGLLLAQNQVKEARAKLKESAAAQSLDSYGLLIWAEILRRENRQYAARKIIERVLRTEPANSAAVRFYLSILMLKPNSYSIATIMVKFLENGGLFEVIEDAFNALIDVTRSIHNFSKAYKTGRLYLTAGYFQKAQQSFATANEVEYSKFEISVIESFLEDKLPNLNLYSHHIHPRAELQIAVNHLASNGKRKECVSFLNSISIPFARLPKSDVRFDPFFFCTMPKSGTVFVGRVIETLLSLKISKVDYWMPGDDVIIAATLENALLKGRLPKGHCTATEDNLRLLERHALPIFLQVRDPRDATWSFFRNVEEESTLVRLTYPYLPQDYSSHPYDEKISLFYEGYFPLLMRWLESWKAVIEAKRISIMVSRYEDFVRNNVSTLTALFTFCNAFIPEEKIELTVARLRDEGMEKGKHNFRHGRAGGWRDIASPEVLDIISKHWNHEVLAYFGYQL